MSSSQGSGVWGVHTFWKECSSISFSRRPAAAVALGYLGGRSCRFLLHRSLLRSTPTNTTESSTVRAVGILFFFFFLIFIYYLFIMFIFGCVGSSFLCEGFLQLRRVGATLHRGARACHYRGLSCRGSRRSGSVVVAHGPSCSAACGIFPDQGSNLCPLHWQADSQSLRHQGSPVGILH